MELVAATSRRRRSITSPPTIAFPYWVTGAQQDSGAVARAVRAAGSPGITMRDWEPLCAGGESGYTAPDPLHPGHRLRRHGRDAATSRPARRRTSRRKSDLPTPARHTWTLPLVFSQADPHALYFGDQYRLQDDRRRRALGADQRRPDARESRRAAEPRRRHRGRRRPRSRSAAASSTRSRRRRCARRCSGSAPTTATSTSRRTTARRGGT